MRSMKFLLPILALVIVICAPYIAFAAETGALEEGWHLIPEQCLCDSENNPAGVDSAPDFKCVGYVIVNLMNLAFSVGIVVFVLVSAYSGFLFMSSSVNPRGKEQAKSMLTNAVVGLVIALGAWLIVDFIMDALYNEAWGPWETILDKPAEACLTVVTPAGGGVSTGGTVTGTTGTTGTGGPTSCTSCVSLSALGLTCKASSSCTASSEFAADLDRIDFSGSWRVTEAYPPTRTHRATCHRNGTCIDAGLTGNTQYTASNIESFADAASAQGLCVVFETDNEDLRDAARQRGVTAHASSEGGGYESITGNHFSVYSNSGDCH